jgi:hypothetical protein
MIFRRLVVRGLLRSRPIFESNCLVEVCVGVFCGSSGLQAFARTSCCNRPQESHRCLLLGQMCWCWMVNLSQLRA